MKRSRLALLMLGPALLAGCATVQHGSGAQKILIDTRPSGASVLVLPDEILLETPTQIRVSRRKARTLRFEKEGYCRETIYVDRVTSTATVFSLLFMGGIGLTIDYLSGAAYTLRPDRVDVFLWPEDSPDRECGPASSMLRKSPRPSPDPL